MATPADNDPLIGTVIEGRFEIRDKLGQGGMGTVYRAWQRSVGREVAIKLIDRSISSDPMATRRFLREAHLASQLSHPNTISVLDFGQLPDGRLFTAMELLRGRTLGRELRDRGAFPQDRIVRVGIQLCDALEAAHAQRIIHRDLKLDNVMLLDAGNDLIKVLDFGLAKTLDDTSTQATAAGIVVGTPRYIAPESAMTGEATPASDMYAVGVMLGELALGLPLWEGATLTVILQSQLQPEPFVAKVPMPVREVVRRLLDTSPQRRPTAAQTRELLRTIAEGKPIEPPPDEKPTLALRTPQTQTAARPRNVKLIIAGAAVFAASVLVTYLVTRDPDKPRAAVATGDKPRELDADDAVDVWHEPTTPAPSAVRPDAARVANDPWSAANPTAGGTLAPIVPAQNDVVQVLFIGIPKDAYVTIDKQEVDTTVTYIERRTTPRLIAVRQRDTQVLFDARSVVLDHDQTIDFLTRQIVDCDKMLSSKSQRYCRSVFCARVPSTPECAIE